MARNSRSRPLTYIGLQRFATNFLSLHPKRFGGICPPAEATMSVNWSKDIDQALVEAKQKNRPILLDFSAAPA